MPRRRPEADNNNGTIVATKAIAFFVAFAAPHSTINKEKEELPHWTGEGEKVHTIFLPVSVAAVVALVVWQD